MFSIRVCTLKMLYVIWLRSMLAHMYYVNLWACNTLCIALYTALQAGQNKRKIQSQENDEHKEWNERDASVM